MEAVRSINEGTGQQAARCGAIRKLAPRPRRRRAENGGELWHVPLEEDVLDAVLRDLDGAATL